MEEKINLPAEEPKRIYNLESNDEGSYQIPSIQERLVKKFGKDFEWIKSKVAPTATKDEIGEYLYICDKYGLDPLKKEAWIIKYGGKSSVIVGRDGLVKIANSHPMFNGMEGDVIYTGDILTRRENGSIKIEYGPEHTKFEKSKIEGAFCNIYRKDREIAYAAIANLKDYDKNANMWSSHKAAMILKVAESIAIKKSFNLSGLLSSEEME
jgi:phage recombination protein Bet